MQSIGNGYYTFPRTNATAQMNNLNYGNTKAFCADWCINVIAVDKAGNGQQSPTSWGTGTECPQKYKDGRGY